MYRVVQHPKTGLLYAGTSTVHDIYQSTRLTDTHLDRSNSGKVIFSTDSGKTWSDLRNFGHPVFWLALDPQNDSILYASVIHSSQGGVYVSKDLHLGASASWTRLPVPTRTQGHPHSIMVLDDGKLLATYAGRRHNNAFTPSSGVFLYDPSTNSWADRSDSSMYYWTKDIVLDPTDLNQNTWYVAVFSGWGGPANGLGGLYRTTNRGTSWTRILNRDRVSSCSFDPVQTGHCYVTTETEGLWHSSYVQAASPIFNQVSNYPFRQPERVFFNPHNVHELWVSSFGHGMKLASLSRSGLGIEEAPEPEEKNTMATGLRLYPNPVNKRLYIVPPTTGPAHLVVYDAQGKTIYDKWITLQQAGEVWELDTHHWPEGLCVLCWTEGGQDVCIQNYTHSPLILTK